MFQKSDEGAWKEAKKRWSPAMVLRENARRNAALQVDYDPARGVGCYGHRIAVERRGGVTLHLPASMVKQWGAERLATMDDDELARARIVHDFEYWCVTCTTIYDKLTGARGPLVLNAAQRRVLAVIERQRQAERPIRLIMLKARQWGGSTLIQLYMAWMQLTQREHWNSLVCAHKLATAAAIKGMYNRVLNNYPKHMTEDGKVPRLKAFEGCRNVSVLSGTDSLVVMGSAQSEDAARGFDLKLAHLSEVAFWPETERHNPQDVMRTVNGTIPLAPGTMVVLESTANGMGNFFHNEWLRAKSGHSDKEAVFVPWFEIEMYRIAVDNVEALWASLDEYEFWLWEECGCTLESINWYHHKRCEQSSAQLFMAEFPSCDIEAFSSNTRQVFAPEHLHALREGCRPEAMRGEVQAHYRGDRVTDTRFVEQASGDLRVWKHPVASDTLRDRYVVAVDVGGRSERSDWSVVTVMDRRGEGGRPEVVAQWKGHCDHDLLAKRAAEIATHYHRALLVIESNTLESENTEGNGGNFILKSIVESYPNLYFRQRYERDGGRKPGFQTNINTKQMVIYNLIAWVRDGLYIERDHDTVNEMSWFELKPNGRSYGAMRGHHDDLVMTRAIGLWVVGHLNRRHDSAQARPLDFIV